MMKALYIKVNSSPLPSYDDNVIYLDYNMENFFCSHLGFELVDDLKTEEGKPLYRLFQPVSLLTEYKQQNLEGYKYIIDYWEDILGKLLNQEPEEGSSYQLSIPCEYTEWLCRNDNRLFSIVGNNIKQRANTTFLDARELYDDTVAVLRQRLIKDIPFFSNKFDCIVIGEPSLRSSSVISKELKAITSKDILTLTDWQKIMDDVWGIKKLMPINDVTLGITPIDLFRWRDDDSIYYRYKKDHLDHESIYFKKEEFSIWDNDDDGILDFVLFTRERELPLLWQKAGFSFNLSYNELLSLLNTLKFQIKRIDGPRIETWDSGKRQVFCADIDAITEDSKLHFRFGFRNNNKNGEGANENAPNTLYDIYAKVNSHL